MALCTTCSGDRCAWPMLSAWGQRGYTACATRHYLAKAVAGGSRVPFRNLIGLVQAFCPHQVRRVCLGCRIVVLHQGMIRICARHKELVRIRSSKSR